MKNPPPLSLFLSLSLFLPSPLFLHLKKWANEMREGDGRKEGGDAMDASGGEERTSLCVTECQIGRGGTCIYDVRVRMTPHQKGKGYPMTDN